MISYIYGEILDIHAGGVEILTKSGLGYDIFINDVTYSMLLHEKEIGLFLYHHITENGQSLFGFKTRDEKIVFKELIKISGVGGKVAIQILSLGLHKLISAVQLDDQTTIQSIKGVGKKMAEKIILELKGKDFGMYISEETENQKKATQLDISTRESILQTLLNMGYHKGDIERVLQEVPQEYETVGEIIPYMIKNLSL